MARSLRAWVTLAGMLGPQRRFLLCLTALAAVCVAAQAVTGISELALYLTPLFLIAALLLSGRFIGEERILARRVTPVPRLRAERQSWARLRERPLASLLERSTSLLRGPPAPAAA